MNVMIMTYIITKAKQISESIEGGSPLERQIPNNPRKCFRELSGTSSPIFSEICLDFRTVYLLFVANLNSQISVFRNLRT
jgi:hypothetical protein